jgi:hypothetical protein
MKTLRKHKKTGQNKEYRFLKNTHGKTSPAEFFQTAIFPRSDRFSWISFSKKITFIKKPQETRRRQTELPPLNTALGAFSGWYFGEEYLSQIMRETLAESSAVSVQADLV